MVDGRFFGHFLWKVEGTVHIHMSHILLTYTVIKVQDGGGGGGIPNIRKLGKFGSILDLMSDSHLELSKIAAT